MAVRLPPRRTGPHPDPEGTLTHRVSTRLRHLLPNAYFLRVGTLLSADQDDITCVFIFEFGSLREGPVSGLRLDHGRTSSSPLSA